MIRRGKVRFARSSRVPSFFKMAAAWWKTPEDPFIFSSLSIDMTRALDRIRHHQEATGEKITITHLCTKALAMAYQRYPQINTKIEGSRIYSRKSIDFMILVSTESGDELSGIKLNDADRKTVSEIALEIREGSAKVRENEGRPTRPPRTSSVIAPSPSRDGS